MAKIFHVMNEEGYSEDQLLERAFKEGCEHGYRKAMREGEYYNSRLNYKEGFEEKIQKLKEKYK